jgi:hypothetical protein
MATYQNYKPGIGSVGSYQIAAVPYITGSAALTVGAEHQISFPSVARSVTVVLNSASTEMKVHFNASGSGNIITGRHYVTLDSKEDAVSFNVRCKEIYVSSTTGTCTYTIIAELTSIGAGEMGALTGSGLTE